MKSTAILPRCTFVFLLGQTLSVSVSFFFLLIFLTLCHTYLSLFLSRFFFVRQFYLALVFLLLLASSSALSSSSALGFFFVAPPLPSLHSLAHQHKVLHPFVLHASYHRLPTFNATEPAMQPLRFAPFNALYDSYSLSCWPLSLAGIQTPPLLLCMYVYCSSLRFLFHAQVMQRHRKFF